MFNSDFRHRWKGSRSSLLQQDPESGDFWTSGPATPNKCVDDRRPARPKSEEMMPA